MHSPLPKMEYTVPPHQAGTRLDKLLAEVCGLSRAAAQLLIANGCVTLGEKTPPKSYTAAEGDVLGITLPPPEESALQPEDIPLDILYEDDALLVINKLKGMVVHPGAGNYAGTLANALLYHCGGRLSAIGGEKRPGIVHRIDKDTSGLLVAAKTDAAHTHLSAQFAAHTGTRVYHAVVYGRFVEGEGTIDAPIARSRADRKKMAVAATSGKQAVTGYRVLGEYPGFSHLELRLQTGRTHQIRVHMASVGHPLAGDAVYGPRRAITSLKGQCLHAKTLGFVHPVTGEYREFDSELPPYFTAFLAELERKL